MKKGDKFVLLLLVFIVVIMAASIGYRFLSERYAPQGAPFSVDEENTTSPTDKNTDTLQNSDTEPTDTSINNKGEYADTSTNTDTENTDSSTATKVPDFTVYDMEGNAVSLYESLGKPVVLNFWATWCGPCQSEMPGFDSMYQKYGDEVTFLMVNVTDGARDTVESVTTFYKDSGYSFPIYFDTTLEAASTYGAYSIPLTFFIDANGNLLYYQMGAIAEDVLSSYMEQLVATGNK